MAGTTAPPSSRIDPTIPSIARAYDAALGGKDNYEVDRAMVDVLVRACPPVKAIARDNREWLIRVARWMARDGGIDQFLDCGSGLPTQENTHDVVQRVNPAATVVYVDNDPICQAHGAALLQDNDRTWFVDGDLTDVTGIVEHPTVVDQIDWTRPVGLIQCATAHHLSDEQQPGEVIRRWREVLPSGSYLALSHFHDPEDGGELSELCRTLEAGLADLGCGWWRPHSTITQFFGDFQLLEPGVVRLCDWWPNGPSTEASTYVDDLIVGGVARKP